MSLVRGLSSFFINSYWVDLVNPVDLGTPILGHNTELSPIRLRNQFAWALTNDFAQNTDV